MGWCITALDRESAFGLRPRTLSDRIRECRHLDWRRHWRNRGNHMKHCPIDGEVLHVAQVYSSTHAKVRCWKCGSEFQQYNGRFNTTEHDAYGMMANAVETKPHEHDGPLITVCPYDTTKLQVVETISHARFARFRCTKCLFEI